MQPEIKLPDGSVVERPDYQSGAIRRRNQNGEYVETRDPEHPKWQEWADRFGVKADRFGEAREARIERAQIEALFRIDGKLNDKPWETQDEDGLDQRYIYHYDGPPSYDDEHRADSRTRGVDYVTVISETLCGDEPAVLLVGPRIYRKVACFVSSGETECPWRDWEEDGARDEPCDLCDAAPGDDHETIYLGEGWAETVYRHGPEDWAK